MDCLDPGGVVDKTKACRSGEHPVLVTWRNKAPSPKVGLTNACKGQRELCATGWAIFNGDRCRVRIDDALDDRKSQSRAPCPPPIAPPEASKDQLPFMLLDSRPLIKDSHQSEEHTSELQS